MEVIAVIVTYNRKELLKECLRAICQQTKKVKKIVVINNASTDGTEEIFKNGQEFDSPQIELHTMERNLGGAGGFYEGIKSAIKEKCDYVWIMDDDTIPFNNTLMEFENSLNNLKNEKISFLASSVWGEKSEPMNVPEIENSRTENGYPCWYSNLEHGMVKIKNATFVSLLISYDAIINVGLPFKNYFLWGDDIEYTFRLTKYYGNAYICGKSKVIHKRKNAKALSIIDEENKERAKMYYYFYRNNLINNKEYRNKKERANKNIKILITIIKLIFKPKIKYRFTKLHAIFKGILYYLIKGYDYKAFKNRFSVNVEYKK